VQVSAYQAYRGMQHIRHIRQRSLLSQENKHYARGTRDLNNCCHPTSRYPQPHQMAMQDAKKDSYQHKFLLQRWGSLEKYTRAVDKPKTDATNSLSELKI